METISPPVLPTLPHDASLFWFLEDQNTTNIQHFRHTEEYTFGSAYWETLASKPESLNEDCPLVLPLGKGRVLFAVLDGASSQMPIKGLEVYGVNGAFFVSHLIGLGFKDTEEYKHLTEAEDITAGEVMEVVNNYLGKKMENISGVNYEDTATIPGMAAAFVIVDPENKRLSIAQVADTNVAASYKDEATKLLTPNLNFPFDEETMEFAQKLANENGLSLADLRNVPSVWQQVKEQLRGSFRKKINKPGGCGVLNGMKALESNHLVYTEELFQGEITSLLIFSDGAVLPYMAKGVTLEEGSRSLMKAFYKERQGSVLEEGAKILGLDPKYDKIPRLKSRDDSTVLLINFHA